MELWDIYDKNKKPTGRTMKRNDWHLKDGEYHLTVLGVVAREDGTFLITKRVMTKAWAPFVQSAVVFGRCHLLEEGTEATEILKKIARKYYPNEQLIDEEIERSGKAVQLFEIDIEHISGKEIQEK